MNFFKLIFTYFTVLYLLFDFILAIEKVKEDFQIGRCQIDSYSGYQLQPDGPVDSIHLKFLGGVTYDTCIQKCCNATNSFKCDVALYVQFTKNCLLIECDPAIDIMRGECGFTSGAMLNEDDLLPMVVEQDTSLTYIDKRNILEDTTTVKPDEEVKEDINSVKIKNKDDQKSQNEDDLEENISENLPKEENVPNIPQESIGTIGGSIEIAESTSVINVSNATTTASYYSTMPQEQSTEHKNNFTTPKIITDNQSLSTTNTTLGITGNVIVNNNTTILSFKNVSETNVSPTIGPNSITLAYTDEFHFNTLQNTTSTIKFGTTTPSFVTTNTSDETTTYNSTLQSDLIPQSTTPTVLNDTVFNSTLDMNSTMKTSLNTTNVPGSGLHEFNSSDSMMIFPTNETISLETTAESTTTTLITTTEGVLSIPVKVKGITNIQLPVDTVTLTAFAKQTPPDKEELQYQWQLLKSPKDQDGSWSGVESVLELSDLAAGIYELKVSVTGPTSKGLAYVNVTVLEPVHINEPPVAVIQPAHQEIDLPTDTAILDGKESTDDVDIVSYHWVALKGPLQNEHVLQFEDGNNIATITHLVEGSYTFQLTVTDTDGSTDSTTATIQVNPKIDSPPIANAGPNQVIHLPQNSLVLCGNGSTDDWGIVGYKWSISQDSGTQVADMQGARSKCLELSNLEAGEYSFQLTVTDDSAQEDTTKVTVIVEPKSNSPPVANAGPDQQILQQLDGDLVAITLDGSKSTDDKGIKNVDWTQISGTSVTIVKPNSLATSVSGFSDVGVYEFKLTISDEEGESNSDTMQVAIKEEQPPVVNPGADLTLRLPNNLAILNGSKSTDDYGIESYKWLKDPKSPAAGVILNGSDYKDTLMIDGLISGTYVFTLTVTNVRGKSSKGSVTVKVLPDLQLNNLVELYLNVDASNFNEETKIIVISKLNVILSLKAEDTIQLRSVFDDHASGNVVMLFYVELGNHTALPALQVMEKINSQLKTNVKLFDVKIARVDTYICENKCSDHGKCHRGSKECECDTFWMENFIRKYVGDGSSNCDWSVLYVVIITIILIVAALVLLYTVSCCILRRKVKKHPTGRKRRGYTTIPKSEYENLLMKSEKNGFKKNGGVRANSNMHKTSSLMRSMTSSSDESTVFEKTHLISNHPPKRRSKPTKKRRKETSLIDVDVPDSNSDDGGFNGLGLDQPGHASNAV